MTLNKPISFLARHRSLAILNAVYAAAGLLWIILIPYNNAPDENTHFHYSVEFIISHHRLPVWGVDDLERFRHALSSYNQMPALNYLAYAAGGALANKVFGLEIYMGARLVSLAWGLVFLNCLFLAVLALCRNKRNALIMTAAVAFIPQVFFTFCYVNADAHSLAIAAVFWLFLVRFLNRQSVADIICAGAAAGLLFSAKYNYYIYFPCMAGIVLWAATRGAVTWKSVWRLVLAAGVLSLLISGYWFIRNWILYGTPLPILMSEEFFQSIGLAREIRPVNRGVSLSSLLWLFEQGFTLSTFDSFFAVFGYLNVGFHPWVYTLLEMAVPALLACFMLGVLLTRDRPARLVLLAMLALAAVVMALHAWACLTYDYQPQGRYNFTILLPAALFCGWAISRLAALKKYAVIFMAIMLCLFAASNLLVWRTYSAPVEFTISQAGQDGYYAKLSPPAYAAERTMQNYYATGKITPRGGAAQAFMIEFSGNFLARYRDFKLELEEEGRVKTIDIASWPSTVPVRNVRLEAALNAVEATGKRGLFTISLPESYLAGSLRITCRIENRRPYDME